MAGNETTKNLYKIDWVQYDVPQIVNLHLIGYFCDQIK